MNNSITKYKEKNTFLHLIDPFYKLISFILITTSVFFARDWESLILMFCFVLIISVLGTINIISYFKLLWFVIIFTLIYGLLYSLILFDIKEGFILSIKVGFRIYILLLIAMIFTSCTRESEIANSLDVLFTPLKFIKLPTYEISIIITLSLRFLPLMIEDLFQIRRAQSSRGFNAINGNFKERIQGLNNSILPLLFISFGRADNMAKSMIVRGYKVGQKRTKYKKVEFGTLEFGSIVFSLLILITQILLFYGVVSIY